MILLCQHGEAKSESEDKTRPLTDKGRKEVERVAKFVPAKALSIDRIFHSGKRRACETAEIFGTYLKPKEGVIEISGINPLDEPEIIVPEIEGLKGTTLIVGHLPHLARLLSLMLTGSKEHNILKFRMGGLVALIKEDSGWAISWVVTPDIL